MYKCTIGLEIHVELKTESKIFCSCPNTFGGEPNTHCCPVCSGFPGVLPVINKKAVEYTIKAGIALGCNINKYSKWDRKNYFYPDLPKAWQTSQYDLPLVKEGKVEFYLGDEKKCVRINRIHLEEDAGKLIHEGSVTKIDYNRCGVPLMEIVTEPDMHSKEEAIAFLEELKSILKYTGVSDVKMQEGSLRCDVNLSVAKAGEKLGTRTETKNLNSFRSVMRSISYEYDRQIEVIESGGKVVQETRRWDDNAGIGYSMRSKENAHDYRYFPEPDLMPVVYNDEELENLKLQIPKLKNERKEKYRNQYNLPDYDIDILTSDREIADLFDATVALYNSPKKISNFIMSEILRKGKEVGCEDITIGINAKQLSDILKMVEDNIISLVSTKEILENIWLTNIDPDSIIDKLNLRQNNDSAEMEAVVKQVIDSNPKVVEDYKSGNPKVTAFFVGQVMKLTKGKGNPKIINEILAKLLK